MPTWYRIYLIVCSAAAIILLYILGQQAQRLDSWGSYPIAVGAIAIWLIAMTWIGRERLK